MKRIYKKVILTCSFAVALAACTDVWDEHYQFDPALSGDGSGDKTLSELISGDSDLSNFAALLAATRKDGISYDSLLMMNRSYTVFAPINANMPKHIDYLSLDEAPKDSLEKYMKEIVENHIANYSHVAGGVRDKEDRKNYKMVPVLNGKSYHFVGRPGTKYTFADYQLNEQNTVAKNGVLHKLDGCVVYQPNLWEKLASLSSVSTLFGFLEKDYKSEFNANLSVPGPIDDGKQTFLDSVFTDKCRWFNEIGQLNSEDSLYTMYALSNDAWDAMYKTVSTYFEYPASMTTLPEKGSMSSTEARDSITKELMCRNLVFSNTVNRKFFDGLRDTLVSNHYSKQLFVGDEAHALKDGTIESYSLSNGSLYVVDQVNYNPFTCWHDTLRVEGESLWYQTEQDVVKNATASGKSIDEDSLIYNQISRGSIGIIKPKEAESNPELNFYVDNILSGYYKVSIVIVPPQLIDPADTLSIAPNKFSAALYFADGPGSGSLAPKAFGSNPSVQIISRGTGSAYQDTVFVSNTAEIDTIVLAECIKVPYCEYQIKSLSGGERKTRLEIISKIVWKGFNKDRIPFDNNFRIDQVLFEPIKAPAGEPDVE